MRKKYQEFNVGKAGSGAIDLATGKLTFVHKTTDAESTILPVGVSHVYQSELSNGNSIYGRGWKLSLNQSLHKVLPDNPNDTRYVYTDGSGTKHEFEEKYFYRENKEKNYYIPNTTIKIRRSDIKIDLDGRMWLLSDTTIEVFSELVTDSGLILHIRPEGFEGSEKLETRHEELIRVESEIKSLKRNIRDLEIQIEQNYNLSNPINVDGDSFTTVRELQRYIEELNLGIEKSSIDNFRGNVKDQDRIRTLRSDARELLRRVNDVINTNAESDVEEANIPLQNNQAEMEDRSIAIDDRNWPHQVTNTNIRETIINLQETLQNIQREFEDVRMDFILENAQVDLKEARIQLARREHTYSQLKSFLPVNYIISENILGFNEDGNLVSIFDDFDNQVSIMYEDERIRRVIDSEERTIEFEYIKNKLDHIKDFQDRKTYFKYDEFERLFEIIYPDNTISTFSYNDNNIMTEILPPLKIGKRLKVDEKNRIVKIIDLSVASLISVDGVIPGEEYTEDYIEIYYNQSNKSTIVKDITTNERVTYFFNEDQKVIHEHLEGKFDKYFITNYETDDYEVSISEELKGEFILLELKEKHLNWANNPATLPSYDENLTWQVTHLDVEGNPLKRFFSETSLPSDNSIRQKREESFKYKHFIDGRKPLLVRSETLIKTTNKPDRNLSEEYFYNKEGEVIRTISLPDGIIEETGYNDKGIITSSVIYHRADPDKRFISKSEVSEEGQTVSSFDETGQHKTTYDYINNTNIVNKITDPRQRNTVFGHDFATNRINSMSSSSNGERNAIRYTYTADFLTKLESGNTKFKYTYDKQGRKSAIYVNDELKPYVTFEYALERHNLHNGMGMVECNVVTTTYASGEIYISYTDIFNRLLAVHYEGKEIARRAIITNFYDEDRLIKTLDYKTNETVLFEYDIQGNIIKQTVKGLFDDKIGEIPAQHLSITQDINIDGNFDKLTYEIDDRNQIYRFDYKDELLTQIHLPSNDILKVDSDNLKRGVKNSILSEGKRLLSDEVSFLQHSNHATNLINYHTQRIGANDFNKTHYTYDEMGNIIETRQAGQIMVKYVYDELNRLKRENNRILDKSYTFEYDNNGNILHKKEFPFTLGTLNEGTLINYTYSDVGDKLMTFNEEIFQYDILGNPVVYRNNNLKWSHLRNLESFNDIEYKYNSANLRVYKDFQKTIDGVDTRFESRYQWLSGVLISETRTSTTNTWSPSDQPIEEHINDLSIKTTTTTLDYIYNTNDKIGFTLNNKETYYYVKNILGDVIKIIDSKGEVVAKYSYDAWGNHKIITSVVGIAELNPIRYRSYYFDEETNLYYLKSRYYDPQTGRFINMDALSYVDPDNIGGLNLYAYCNNNPVMHTDPNGTFILSGIIGGIIIGAIIGGTVAAAVSVASTMFTWATGGGFHWCWRDFGTSVIGGAIVGGLVGSGLLAKLGAGKKLTAFIAGVLSNTISMVSNNIFGDGNHTPWEIIATSLFAGGVAALTVGVLNSERFLKSMKGPGIWNVLSEDIFLSLKEKVNVKMTGPIFNRMFAISFLKKSVDSIAKRFNSRFGFGRLFA